MEELTDAINLVGAYPVIDDIGMHTKPFRFKLTNKCGVGVNYNLNLEVMEVENDAKRVASKNIATRVDNLEKKLLNENIKITDENYEYTGIEAYTLYQGSLEPYESTEHSVRLWLDESADNEAQNGKFYSKVVIQSFQNQIVEYREGILNGADPVLADKLIPVEIDDTGRVTKADLSKAWYSYEEKKWANAVILEDENITYQNNEEIPEDNIESYFVWIPKYSYELWDLGNYSSPTAIDTKKVHAIPIKFGTENTSDSNSGECTTPMTSGASGNCKIGDYMTPPAFITMGTNGLWVGKFETGYKGATTATAAEVNPSFTSTTTESQIKGYSEKIQIKPNVYSWREIQVANAHLTSYNYKRELDSHMMKNTEWGTVAYLHYSKYGRATNVRLNNNSAYITGYAAKNEPTTGYTNTNLPENIYESTTLGSDGTNTYNYKNTLSQVASTTGNYTGIYDMSGGAAEYMMGVMLDSTNTAPHSGYNSTHHSNFNGALGGNNGEYKSGINFPNERYFDKYTYSNDYTTYQRRILGDATAEFGPFATTTYGTQTLQIGSWYMNHSRFVGYLTPWLLRSGIYDYGSSAGMFHFEPVYGHASSRLGFRIVLAI